MALTEQEQRVCSAVAIRAPQILDDLRLHVGLPTGGRNVAALDETRRRLVERAAAMGASVQSFPGEVRPDWLYGDTPSAQALATVVCRRASAGREILLAGHLDTVHDPRGAFRELILRDDGRTAVGPGCVDMKGGLVICLAALECLESSGVRLNWTLLLNSDEETGSYHSAGTIAAEAARVASGGGVGIALEPATAEGGLVIERAGSGQFMLEVYGKSAHVGRDFASGVSAVLVLAELILRAGRLARPELGEILNIGPISGGQATNVVPDHARAWGNVRFATMESAKRLEAALKELEETAASGSRIRVHTSFIRPAKPLTTGTQRLAEVARASAEALEQKLPFSKTAGVCDGNIMQAAGLATIDTMGVRGGGLHTPDEWIELSSLVERSQLLAVTMMRVARCQDGFSL